MQNFTKLKDEHFSTPKNYFKVYFHFTLRCYIIYLESYVAHYMQKIMLNIDYLYLFMITYDLYHSTITI